MTELAVDDTVSVDGVQARATYATTTVAAVRAGHRNGRGPGARSVVSAGSTVYFAGDTDLFPGMADLAPRLDLAILPIGGWGPDAGPGHLDPARAAKALTLLGARRAIPIHWAACASRFCGGGSSRLSTAGEGFQAYARALARAWTHSSPRRASRSTVP